MPEPPTSESLSRAALWFAALGGGIAWTVHLLAAALIAEWGCVAGLYRYTLLGVTAIAWAIIAASVVLAAVAIAATWKGFQLHRWLQANRAEIHDPRGTARFMARAGLLTSGLFTLIIIVESVPILFFLSRC